MFTPPIFDSRMVYRITLPSDTLPQARLAIGPIYEFGCVRFFDTSRERILAGNVSTDRNSPQDDTIHFVQTDGTVLHFEPLTLARYQEIAHDIDGQPHFSSIDALLDFYRNVAGIA